MFLEISFKVFAESPGWRKVGQPEADICHEESWCKLLKVWQSYVQIETDSLKGEMPGKL